MENNGDNNTIKGLPENKPKIPSHIEKTGGYGGGGDDVPPILKREEQNSHDLPRLIPENKDRISNN